MTPEQQRIAIAEACGYYDFSHGIHRQTQIPWLTGKHKTLSHDGYKLVVPNYLNDLNAMHEAEKVLTDDTLLAVYGSWLNKLCDIYPRKTMLSWSICATAAQRSEAFLRTLNLWTNE